MKVALELAPLVCLLGAIGFLLRQFFAPRMDRIVPTNYEALMGERQWTGEQRNRLAEHRARYPVAARVPLSNEAAATRLRAVLAGKASAADIIDNTQNGAL
jgi:hypothetical protein